MSLLKALGLVRGQNRCVEPANDTVEQDADDGRAVFQDAELHVDDFHHMRAVVTHVSAHGARIAYAARMDLPFRVRITAHGLKLKCWARVVSQTDGAAELAFEADAEPCC